MKTMFFYHCIVSVKPEGDFLTCLNDMNKAGCYKHTCMHARTRTHTHTHTHISIKNVSWLNCICQKHYRNDLSTADLEAVIHSGIIL